MTSREPLQIVVLKLRACANTFGTAPCTATAGTGLKCFKTFPTCQDPDNYTPTTLDLYFSKNQRTGIVGQTIFPFLKSVSTSPTRISLSGVDGDQGPLGKRERVVIRFGDGKDSDRVTDPYIDERLYDPLAEGRATFWPRQLARSGSLFGIEVEVKNGYVGDSIASMRTFTYVATEVRGPNGAGEVELTVQDPTKLFDEEFAQVPKPSNGRLGAAISAGFTGDVTLSPSGVGSEYDASGRVSIGREVITYTRSGDVLTITERGVDGSEAASHEADDTAQLCYRVEDGEIQDVVEDLMQTYAATPSSRIPIADWTSECQRWLSTIRLTRTIPKPIPVIRAVGEICDLGLSIWWDKVGQEYKLRANRPPDVGESFATLTEGAELIEGETSRENREKLRLTRVSYWSGVNDYTEDTDDSENYSVLSLEVDATAESQASNDGIRNFTIYQPWLGQAGAETTTNIIARRLVNRYLNTPVRMTFVLDAKDRASVEPGDLVKINSRLFVDEFGAIAELQAQVISVDEFDPGHAVRVVAETYQFDKPYRFFTENAAPVYGSATEAEKETGAYFSNAGADFSDGKPAHVFF